MMVFDVSGCNWMCQRVPIRANSIIKPSVWSWAKLQEPNYTIVISYLLLLYIG